MLDTIEELQSFADCMTLDADKTINAFWIHLQQCQCWFCVYWLNYFSTKPLHVPFVLLKYVTWRSFLHFCLYSSPNADLN